MVRAHSKEFKMHQRNTLGFLTINACYDTDNVSVHFSYKVAALGYFRLVQCELSIDFSRTK